MSSGPFAKRLYPGVQTVVSLAHSNETDMRISYAPIIRYLEKRNVLKNVHPYSKFVIDMAGFDALYSKGVEVTGTPASASSRDRYFNLCNALKMTNNVAGEVVECGCWKGLSSFLLNATLGTEGRGYHIFDSFEGLSEPEPGDRHPAGQYAYPLESVRRNLAQFPHIEFHKGWLPQALDGQPERTYRFVHIDVDLPKPVLGSLEYFEKRMSPGGVIVCDDYGIRGWVGTKDQIDSFIERRSLRALQLSTGQVVIIF